LDILDNQVYIGGVSACELADQFGTPLFVIEEDSIRRQYRALRENITHHPLVVHYACKANSNVQVMRVLRDEGAHIHACSPGDVHLALAAGYEPQQVSYTGYAVSEDELRLAITHGLLVQMDSLSQFERYARLGGRGRVGVRLNSGVEAGYHPHFTSGGSTDKFGIHPAQLEEALELATAHGLSIVGLHSNLGSDILEVDPFVDALQVVLELADRCEDLEYVNLGGGLGVPFHPDDEPFDLAGYGRALGDHISRWCDERGRELTLCLEPGEFLVAEAGSLLTSVIDVKPAVQHGDTRSPTFVGTDTSCNHLFGAAVYGAYHHVLVADRAEDPATERVYVCGNVMQTGDILARDRVLPPLQEGDLLVFRTCGAYSMCRASRFNGRPLPAEVMVKDGRSRLIRERETLDDLLSS